MDFWAAILELKPKKGMKEPKWLSSIDQLSRGTGPEAGMS